MKKKQRIIKQVIAGAVGCLLLLQCPVFFVHASAINEPDGLYSTAAVLMDADSGRVLYEKNASQVLAMASTTKIMTCILALEKAEPQQIVTFSDLAASMPDVQMNACAGEQYYLKDLLYSMMLESHNDSAAAIAEAVAGDVPAFVRLMNRKAEMIGCMNTHFVTPNGLDGEDEEGIHSTTAEDLAKIMRYCIGISASAEQFLEITSAQTYSFSEISGKRYVSCRNHNAFLDSYEGALSGKTGFTGKAGYCYTGAVKRDDRTFVIALLECGWYPHRSYKWKDAGKIFNYAFDNYYYETVGKEKWKFPEIAVKDGMEETVPLKTDAGKFSCLLKKGEHLRCREEYAKELQAPVAANTVVGTISYELDGKIQEQFQIYTAEEVEKATFWKRLRRFLKKF